MAEPLAGVRVLERGTGVAVAFAARLLADFGADVVRLASPDDPARRVGPFPPHDRSVSGRALYLDAGKRVLAAADAVTIARLSAGADVVVVDTVIDDTVIDDTVIDGDGSRGLLPGAPVRCSIRPFGSTGPYRDFAGTHLTTFHAGGEGSILPSGDGWLRYPARPPLQLGSDAADFDAGFTAAIAIVAALRARHRSGRGQAIDISAQEAQLTLNRTRLSRFANDGVVLRRSGRVYLVGGMIECADRCVQVVGVRDEHLARLAEHPEGAAFAGTPPLSAETAAELQATLARWCRERRAADVATLLGEAGVSAGVFLTAADITDSPQLACRGYFQAVEHPGLGTVRLPGLPYRLSATPARLRSAPVMVDDADAVWASGGTTARPPRAVTGRPDRARPLEGIRVVDLTWAAAGPYATLLLAFLGADVIKVETGRRPDPARRGFLEDYGDPERSPNFNELNLGKRSFCVDLKSPAGVDLVRRLIAVSDVVVDNFRPGVMERFGLGPHRLLEEHPRLVVASSSANGSSGPDAARAGLASIFGATGGLSAQTGYADGPPTEVGESNDYRSGNALALAILVALVHRDRAGTGQFVDLASQEAIATIAPDHLLAHALGAEGWLSRIGNAHRLFAPHGVYRTAEPDGWLALAVTTEPEWRSLARVIGRPGWGDEHRHVEQRRANIGTIDAAIEGWTSGRTAQAAFLELQAEGVPAAPSLTNAALVGDAHLAARGVFRTVHHPRIGACRVMRAPWRSPAMEGEGPGRGPLLGEHNGEVLDLLGVPAADRPALAEVLR